MKTTESVSGSTLQTVKSLIKFDDENISSNKKYSIQYHLHYFTECAEDDSYRCLII